jgi:sulfatase maturation enzyme AslB (radical SAM superfamily)
MGLEQASRAREDGGAAQAPAFASTLARHGLSPLRRLAPTTLQVNVGKRCDLACHHCHVEAGPKRSETMDARTAARVLELLARDPRLATLDLTGAPRAVRAVPSAVEGARALGR